MIGVGITTLNRPSFAEKSVKALLRNCGDIVDRIAVYNDGSDPKYHGAYQRAYKPLVEHDRACVQQPGDNRGVSYAKNRLCEYLLAEGCDWVFLLEDDIKITSPHAVTEYIRVAKSTTLHHLSFAHHGPANIGGPVEVDGELAYYPHSIGAWCLYSREFLLNVGVFDENFKNCWEHVEIELRAFQEGYAPNGGAHRFVDVVGSEQWLSEIPGSIEKSSIRPRADWHDNIRNGLIYWRDNKPETFNLLFGPEMPLHNYASGIIGN